MTTVNKKLRAIQYLFLEKYTNIHRAPESELILYWNIEKALKSGDVQKMDDLLEYIKRTQEANEILDTIE